MTDYRKAKDMRNCDYCMKNFKNEIILAQHMRDVHEEKTFRCEICAKSFSRKQTLEEHVSSVHKKLKPFKCEICKNKFARKTQLNGHIRVVHEKTKHHKCTMKKCNFAADTTRNLKVHISEVHEGNKPFKCEICNKSFARKSHLEQHWNRKNNCQKSSSFSAKLKVSSTVKFHKEWKNIYSWVTNDASGNSEMAFCKVCCETLPAQKLAFHHKSMKHRKNQFKNPINHEKIRGKKSSEEKIEKCDYKIDKSGEWNHFIIGSQIKKELGSTFSESPEKDPLNFSHSESIKKEMPVESLSYVKDEGIESFCSDAPEINQLAFHHSKIDKSEVHGFQKDQKVSGYFICLLCDHQFDKVKDVESHSSTFHKVSCNYKITYTRR